VVDGDRPSRAHLRFRWRIVQTGKHCCRVVREKKGFRGVALPGGPAAQQHTVLSPDRRFALQLVEIDGLEIEPLSYERCGIAFERCQHRRSPCQDRTLPDQSMPPGKEEERDAGARMEPLVEGHDHRPVTGVGREQVFDHDESEYSASSTTGRIHPAQGYTELEKYNGYTCRSRPMQAGWISPERSGVPDQQTYSTMDVLNPPARFSHLYCS